VHFCNNSSATSALVAEVGTTTDAVPNGYFRLGLVDGAGVLQADSNLDLAAPSPAACKVVTRYDVDAAQSTLWVDGTSEASPSVSVVDLATPQNISYVGLRQLGHRFPRPHGQHHLLPQLPRHGVSIQRGLPEPHHRFRWQPV
jgi:hypothetical protein